jgi:hypothetical protein
MSEIPSPATCSSSSDVDGEEVLTYEEILEEASMDAHSAANTCSCGEHSSMMAVFGLMESGRVVDAAAGIVAALGLCKCDEALKFLRDALEVVAQLGGSPEEKRQLQYLWVVGQEQSTAALAGACPQSS